VAETGRKRRSKHRATKDRVLQARIPQDLDTELRVRAEQWGLSVSTVVRNALLHTFDLVEGVVADSTQLARVMQGRKAPYLKALPELSEPGSKADVVGWQEIVLNRNGVCEECNEILARGQRAAVGLPVQPRPVLLCLSCLAALFPADDDQSVTAKSPPSAGSGKKPARRRDQDSP
jgi:hypothetical protein